MPARDMTLRRLFVLIGVGVGAYVMLVAGYLQFSVRPRADSLQIGSEAVANAFGLAQARIAGLGEALERAELMTRSWPEGEPLTSDSTRVVQDAVRDAATARGSSESTTALSVVPDETREALGSLATREVALGTLLGEVVLAAELGDAEGVEDAFREATELRAQLLTVLGIAQSGALQRLSERERELGRTAAVAASTLTWSLILGAVLLLGAALLLRERFYRPLARLEASLARVAEGDLAATVRLPRDDEMGRLGTVFNQMTSVLLERAYEDQQHREGVAQRYGRILDESTTEIFALDRNSFRILESNRRALDHLGYRDEELRLMNALDLWHQEHGTLADLFHALITVEWEEKLFLADQIRRDGSSYPVEVKLYDAPQQDPPVIMAIVHDITERRRLEDVHERLARFALEKSRIFQSGQLETGVAAITENATSTLEVDRASVWLIESGGLRCIDLFDTATGEHLAGEMLLATELPAHFRAVAEDRTMAVTDAVSDSRTSEFAASRRAPQKIASLLDAPIRVGGRLAGVIRHEHGSPRDWTAEERVVAAALADFVAQALESAERRRAEEALRHSENRFRTAFEEAAVGMAEAAPDGRLLRANRRLSEMIGYGPDELIELTWWDITHPKDEAVHRVAVEQMLAGRRSSYQREARYLHKDGSTVWVDVSTAPVVSKDGSVSRFILVVQDVSEARSLRTQLAHAQKMESIGRLAGGIAHDFNNLLTAILGNVELAKSELAVESRARGDLDEIEKSAVRATKLTSQLLTFARRRVVEAQIVDLNEATAGAETLLRRLISERVELVVRLEAEAAHVRIDSGQFEQVIMNLAVNARDAMPEGGRLEIRTGVAAPGEHVEALGGQAEDDEYVILAVTDNGVGMEPEVMGRLFEPFFTTKAAGHGTGLGLAICYGIVGQAGGHIGVESVPGEGTTFKIFLPLARSSEMGSKVEAVESGDGRGSEVVLLVEDEDAVRKLVERALGQKGYEVLSAAHGDDALKIVSSRGADIDVLITDIVMPRMGGLEVAALVKERVPGVKVLYISGYSDSEEAHRVIGTAGKAFLAKPFSPSELARRVRTLCDGPQLQDSA